MRNLEYIISKGEAMEVKIYDNNRSWFYRVKKEDEEIPIEKFLLRFNISKEEFDLQNPNSTMLRQGDVLIIPSSQQFCHVVVPLETFDSLSRRYNISIDEIKKSCETTVLFVGQKIFIWFFLNWCYTYSI